jgi:hypothetical protein
MNDPRSAAEVTPVYRAHRPADIGVAVEQLELEHYDRLDGTGNQS